MAASDQGQKKANRAGSTSIESPATPKPPSIEPRNEGQPTVSPAKTGQGDQSQLRPFTSAAISSPDRKQDQESAAQPDETPQESAKKTAETPASAPSGPAEAIEPPSRDAAEESPAISGPSELLLATSSQPIDFPLLDTTAAPAIDLGIDTSSSPARGDVRITIEQVGSRYHRERGWIVLWLGIAAVGLAALCAIPSLMDQVDSWRGRELRSPDAWTYLVLLASLVQAAVAIYAMQLPDWSTSWVVGLVTTGIAAIYALGLALTMFADQEHQIVRQLGLLDESFHGTAQRWCFLVTCVMLILAYCYGRFSLRWYLMEKELGKTRSYVD